MNEAHIVSSTLGLLVEKRKSCGTSVSFIFSENNCHSSNQHQQERSSFKTLLMRIWFAKMAIKMLMMLVEGQKMAKGITRQNHTYHLYDKLRAWEFPQR